MSAPQEDPGSTLYFFIMRKHACFVAAGDKAAANSRSARMGSKVVVDGSFALTFITIGFKEFDVGKDVDVVVATTGP